MGFVVKPQTSVYRTHLQHYGAHIHYTVVRRRESFQRSLEPFELPAPAEHEMGMMRHRRSTEQSLVGAIHRKSRPFGMSDQQELDQWVEIEDDTTFEIAPYRYYTQVTSSLSPSKIKIRFLFATSGGGSFSEQTESEIGTD